ncbi:LrgB family protein [Mesobacillus foraminis]|uniref:LrgB family protein n=1 Tax=Mesobacillus foraminis TaxID=279826 RepID=UPI0039A05204
MNFVWLPQFFILTASLIPRSVTLPIALVISTNLGGISSTTIFFVITSALVSLIVGPKLLYLLGINSKSAKGLAMGTSAQMLGASRSFAWGEEEGAMGNIAMTTSAIFLSLLVPILTLFFNHSINVKSIFSFLSCLSNLMMLEQTSSVHLQPVCMLKFSYNQVLGMKGEWQC